MNWKLVSLSGAAVVAVGVIGFVALTGSRSSQDGPSLVGQMSNFVVVEEDFKPTDVSWVDVDGQRFSLSDFEGKIVLFNYWASWCGPCQRELPGIDRTQAKLGGSDFEVIAMNIDEGGKEVALRNAARLGLTNLNIYIDPEHRTPRKIGLRAMPSTFLFDRQGKMLGMLEGGAEWDSVEAHELIKYFIDRS